MFITFLNLFNILGIMMIVIENVNVIETENVIGNVNVNRPLVGEQ